jgi:hypothetical protein
MHFEPTAAHLPPGYGADYQKKVGRFGTRTLVVRAIKRLFVRVAMASIAVLAAGLIVLLLGSVTNWKWSAATVGIEGVVIVALIALFELALRRKVARARDTVIAAKYRKQLQSRLVRSYAREYEGLAAQVLSMTSGPYAALSATALYDELARTTEMARFIRLLSQAAAFHTNTLTRALAALSVEQRKQLLESLGPSVPEQAWREEILRFQLNLSEIQEATGKLEGGLRELKEHESDFSRLAVRLEPAKASG